MPAILLLFLSSALAFRRWFPLRQPAATSTTLWGKTRTLNCDLTKQLAARENNALIQTSKSAKQLIVSSISQFDVDEVSFGAAMNVCNELDQPETCIEIFDLMKRPSQSTITPNRLCYSFVINACMQLGDFDKADALFAECDATYSLGHNNAKTDRSHEHDSGLYNTIIASRAKVCTYGTHLSPLNH